MPDLKTFDFTDFRLYGLSTLQTFDFTDFRLYRLQNGYPIPTTSARSSRKLYGLLKGIHLDP